MADNHGRRKRVPVLLLPPLFKWLEDEAAARGMAAAKYAEKLIEQAMARSNRL
jgi:hypothetical protein